MKRFLKKAAAIILSAAMVFGCITASQARPAMAAQSSVMKAVWFSFNDYQLYLQGRSQKDYDSSFNTICAAVAAQGCNTIIVHVRSHNDAVYPSSIYPWSSMMLNGVDPGFDPLADMVQIAHNNGLKIHAWINPYGYRNGAYSGNAALATYDNIVAGVKEIVSKYAVDGIHFDDYFPPIGAANINYMIASVHQVCAAYGKTFGIAPQGNVDNNVRMGADVYTWLSTPGYIDYICPQIYWTDNYGKAGTTKMFSQRLAQWKAMDKIGIPMYVGMALYKCGVSASYDPGWSMSTSNLAYQAQVAKAAGYQGYFLFRASDIVMPNAVKSAELTNLRNAW